MDDSEDGEETYNEVKENMDDDVTFIDMPIKESETNGERDDADDDIFSDTCRFQITMMTKLIAQKEKGYTAD